LISFLNWRTHLVIAGLVPAISTRMVELSNVSEMAGTKPGHDTEKPSNIEDLRNRNG